MFTSSQRMTSSYNDTPVVTPFFASCGHVRLVAPILLSCDEYQLLFVLRNDTSEAIGGSRATYMHIQLALNFG